MTSVQHNPLAREHEGYSHVGIPPGCPACAQARRVEIIPLEAKRIDPRRRVGVSRRRVWDVVTMVVVGAMLWWAGYLAGHAEARVVVHTMIVYAL